MKAIHMTVDEVAAKDLPHTEEDEEVGDESPHIGGDEGGPAHVMGDTPDNGS